MGYSKRSAISADHGRRSARAAAGATSKKPHAKTPIAEAICAIAVISITFVAYAPALTGGLLWDDDAHLTPPALRNLTGLLRIWTDPTATQQYYPVTHSVFWLVAQFVDRTTWPYHAINVALHALAACLLALLLRRWSVRGPWLAALLFALHPLQVESVAWMSELKNVLSGVAFFAAALAYDRYDATRRRAAYAAALALFLVALLSKSVTAVLPVMLAASMWWRRGRLRWRDDLRPLVPFVIAGATAGAITALIEHSVIGAHGAEFELSIAERVLIAGRAIWFYIAAFAWPASLTFNYPRWQISAVSVWQWLWPLAAAAAAAVAWRLRHRTRAPVAALAAFVVALAPALGFINVYPFRYAFVADHFQYLASAVLCTVAAACIWRLPVTARRVTAPIVVAVFGAATWIYAHDYRDAETLYRATLQRNPSSWFAHNNLASLLIERGGDSRNALAHADAAVALKPDLPAAHFNRGIALQDLGDADGAKSAYATTLRLREDHAKAHMNLGVLLDAAGDRQGALMHLARAVELWPQSAEARNNYGTVLMEAERVDEGIARFREATSIDPGSVPAWCNLVIALSRSDRVTEAQAAFDALRARSPQAAQSVAPELEEAYRRHGK